MRGWLQWIDVRSDTRRNAWFGRADALESRAVTVESLPKRVSETAARVRKELTSFIRMNGPMPEAVSTEDFGELWSWQGRMNGWYDVKVKPVIVPLFDELAAQGLTDSVVDNLIHQSDQTEESVSMITQRLMMLAARL
ncbi:MAG TPA: hypothetical protein VMH85_08540 [Terriglobales bacterium]|nr:hypothetical protein [Terriglobales bacterium]